MSFHELAPELIYSIFNNLSTISDVINLSITCQRFYHLLRASHKLPTLFGAAECEFGPIEDIINLVTYNQSQPVHFKRKPPLSYALLRQIIPIGKVAKKYEQLYPDKRWNTAYIYRRSLTNFEGYSLRRAIYRYWLYCEAFHNRNYPRSVRLLGHIVEERSQLLRIWSTNELCEIEDIRTIFEDIIMDELCPTDGISQIRTYEYNSKISIRKPSYDVFHSSYDDTTIQQYRQMHMEGWGDEITQYHTVQSILKLNPAQILVLYEKAIYKCQIEGFISEIGGDWFWNNGQTFLDTWLLILHKRGIDPLMMREEITERRLGIAVDDKN